MVFDFATDKISKIFIILDLVHWWCQRIRIKQLVHQHKADRVQQRTVGQVHRTLLESKMEKFGWHGKVSIFRKQSVRLHIPTVQQFSNSESSPGSFYKLQVRSNDQAQWTDVSDKIDQNVHIVTGNVIRTQIWPTTFLFRLGLIPGISYRFRVAQKNKTGDSIPSKASQRIGINIWAGQSRTPYNSFHAILE